MAEPAQRGLPAWAVVVTAIVTPIVFAVLFVAAIDTAQMPLGPRPDPDAGYAQAYTDEAILFLYVVVQAGFLLIAPWVLTQRSGLRKAFFAIAVPLSLLFSLIAVISQIAA